jgi:hypothetical protein
MWWWPLLGVSGTALAAVGVVSGTALARAVTRP